VEAAGIEPSSSSQQNIDTSDVTTRTKPLGVSGEYGEFSDCHQMAGIGADLWAVIKVWQDTNWYMVATTDENGDVQERYGTLVMST